MYRNAIICIFLAFGLQEYSYAQNETELKVLNLPEVIEIARDQSPLAVLDTSNKEFGRVGAVLAVHQIGMPCDLKAILEISEKHWREYDKNGTSFHNINTKNDLPIK